MNMPEDSSSENYFYDEPGSEQLDSILANVRNEVLAHVHSTSDLASALLKIMDSEDGQMVADDASVRPPTGVIVADRLSTVVNMRHRAMEIPKRLRTIIPDARLLAGDLDRDLNHYGDLAIGIKVTRVIARHRDRRLIHYLDEARELTVGITYDLIQIRRLDREVTMNRDLEVIGELSRDVNRGQTLDDIHGLDKALTLDRQLRIDQQIDEARELLIELNRARRLSEDRMKKKNLSREEARKLALEIELALGRSLDTSTEILYRLNMLEVDACSIDLSELKIADPTILIGVIYTDDTVWPSKISKSINKLSYSLSPGFYKVRARDPQSMVHGRHAATQLQTAGHLRLYEKRGTPARAYWRDICTQKERAWTSPYTKGD